MKLFVTKLKEAAKESRLKRLANIDQGSSSIVKSKTRRETGVYFKVQFGKNSEAKKSGGTKGLLEFQESISRHSIPDANGETPRNALRSPTSKQQSGFSLARPLLKHGTTLQRQQNSDTPSANIIFERKDHAKRISAKFQMAAKPQKAFKLFPIAMEHDLRPPSNSRPGEIQRNKSQQHSSTSVRSPTESELASKVNFTQQLNRLLLNSRVNIAREQERDLTEKQKAIEKIVNDRALTPSMQRRKIEVFEKEYAEKEVQKRKEKEDKRKKELDDALQGKR